MVVGLDLCLTEAKGKICLKEGKVKPVCYTCVSQTGIPLDLREVVGAEVARDRLKSEKARERG